MAQGQDRSRHQQGIVNRYYANRDTLALQNIAEIASDLFLCEQPGKAARLWDRAAKALAHTDADDAQVQKIVADRDIAALSRLVNHLTAPDRGRPAPATPGGDAPAPPAPTPPAASASAATPNTPPDAQVLRGALKAFRKRLKLTRLDEDSKLGVGPLSSGRRSGVVAIAPPSQFPAEVWEALVQQGRLKRAGRGFYALSEDKNAPD